MELYYHKYRVGGLREYKLIDIPQLIDKQIHLRRWKCEN